MIFSVKITILSDTKYLAPLRQLVEAAAQVVGQERFSEQAQKVCTLSLIEAVDNAIFHAHHHQEKEPIDVTLTVGNSSIDISVQDRGQGINSGTIDGEAPELLATSGRGLYLISELMTKVISRRNAKGHEVVMSYDLKR